MKTATSVRALAFTFLLLGSNQAAHAQALPVDVDITVEDGGVAILNYYSALDVTIDPGDLATLALDPADTCPTASDVAQCPRIAAPSGTAEPGPGAGGGDLNADGGLVLAAPLRRLNNIRLDMDNVWAVRSIGGLTNSTTVTIGIGTAPVLANATVPTSTITIIRAQGYLMSGGTVDEEVEFLDPGLEIPTFGGVQLTLDMENALSSGVYSTAAASDVDPNYTIEITGT